MLKEVRVSRMDLSVDQPCDGHDSSRMIFAMMSVHLSYALESAGAPNGVFDTDAAAGERSIVSDIFGRSLFATRFAPRRGR